MQFVTERAFKQNRMNQVETDSYSTQTQPQHRTGSEERHGEGSAEFGARRTFRLSRNSDHVFIQ